MADHICSPVALPWRDYGEQTGACIPMESTGLAGTVLMGEVRGASGSEGWQRGVTAASPVPSGCTSTEIITPVDWSQPSWPKGSCMSPPPSREAGRAEVLPVARGCSEEQGKQPGEHPCARSPCSWLRRCSPCRSPLSRALGVEEQRAFSRAVSSTGEVSDLQVPGCRSSRA